MKPYNLKLEVSIDEEKVIGVKNIKYNDCIRTKSLHNCSLLDELVNTMIDESEKLNIKQKENIKKIALIKKTKVCYDEPYIYYIITIDGKRIYDSNDFNKAKSFYDNFIRNKGILIKTEILKEESINLTS